jgi:hypothetical protein
LYLLCNPVAPAPLIPKRTLARRRALARVDYVDARPYFDAGRASTDYFLAYDAAHLSGLGHRVMADVVTEALERPRRVTSPGGS